eukprot:4719589-Pleurochrysis_carterae.AAC.2
MRSGRVRSSLPARARHLVSDSISGSVQSRRDIYGNVEGDLLCLQDACLLYRDSKRLWPRSYCHNSEAVSSVTVIPTVDCQEHQCGLHLHYSKRAASLPLLPPHLLLRLPLPPSPLLIYYHCCHYMRSRQNDC